MASVRGTASTFDTASGTKTVLSTATVSDYIAVYSAHTGSTAVPTITDTAGGTYSLVTSAAKNTSADKMFLHVRNALITSTGSITFTYAPGTTTGGGLAVYFVVPSPGASTGTAAVRTTGIAENVTASATKTVTLSQAVLSTSVMIGGVFNGVNGGNVTEPTGFTRNVNVGYNTPPSGLSAWSDNSGQTATFYQTGSATSICCQIMAEFNLGTNDVSVLLAGASATASAGTAGVSFSKELLGVAATLTAGTFALVYGPDGKLVTEAGDQLIDENGIDDLVTENFVSPDVTLALTGASATFSAGVVTPTPTFALTGAAATFSTGVLGIASTIALTGSASTFAAGSVTANITKALAGSAATFATGTIATAQSVSLTGAVSTFATGTPTANLTIPLSGAAFTASAGIIEEGISQPLVGTQASFTAGTVSVASTIALSGAAATANAGIVTPAYTRALAGSEATFAAGLVTPSITKALTGALGTFTAGTPAVAISVAITGFASTFATGSISRAITVTLTGAQMQAQTGLVSTGADVNVALTGSQVASTAGNVGVAMDVALFGQDFTAYTGIVTPDTGPTVNPGANNQGFVHRRGKSRVIYGMNS